MDHQLSPGRPPLAKGDHRLQQSSTCAFALLSWIDEEVAKVPVLFHQYDARDNVPGLVQEMDGVALVRLPCIQTRGDVCDQEVGLFRRSRDGMSDRTRYQRAYTFKINVLDVSNLLLLLLGADAVTWLLAYSLLVTRLTPVFSPVAPQTGSKKGGPTSPASRGA